jgi:hypothetical protein
MSGEGGPLDNIGPAFLGEPVPSTIGSAARHADNCDWHLDQYDFECTCGAVANPEAKRPGWMRRANYMACIEASRIAFGPSELEQCGVRFKRGWFCSRELGHDGPCALWPVSHEAASESQPDFAELQALLDAWRSARRGFLAWLKGLFL